MSGLKRKSLSVDDKVAIIKAVESGRKKADVCREFGLVNSTICTIVKNKNKIMNTFVKGKEKSKKIRSCEKVEIDEALITWFKQCRSANLPVNGPLLMRKAEEFGSLFGYTNFKCSNGWLERFKRRHSITFGKVSGEAKSVNMTEAETWLNEVWPKLRQDYEDNEIYNGDETGIFYKLLPDKTLRFKGEKCVGGKLAKERLTALVCANMTGTEKRKILVIGKSKKPRCFKNIKTLPTNYCANKRAWMTSEIFENEIRKWDKELAVKGKNILLLVDNCPAHPSLAHLKNINLVFLPPNCTSILQPMDQGVIRSLKCFYRKFLLQKIITGMDKNEPCAVSLLDALDFLEKAWRSITSETIANCFSHSRLRNNPVCDNLNEDDEDDVPLCELIKRWQQNQSDENQFCLDDFASVDSCLITSEMRSDSDIVEDIKQRDNENDNEIEEEEDSCDEAEHVPTNEEALSAIKLLKTYYRQRETSPQIIDKVRQLEMDIEKEFWRAKTVQRKITDFFN